MSVGVLVEACEAQGDVTPITSLEQPLELTIPDPLHDQGFGHAYGLEGADGDSAVYGDVVNPDAPDPIPEDQIEHASGGLFDDCARSGCQFSATSQIAQIHCSAASLTSPILLLPRCLGS